MRILTAKRISLGALMVGLVVMVINVIASREEIFHAYVMWKVGHLTGAIKEEAFERTALLGGGGGGPFDDVFKGGALLTGFRVTTATFYGGHLTVKSLQPIFLSGRGRDLGAVHGIPNGPPLVVEAKKGYAVGALVAETGHRVDGFRLVFMRIGASGLQPMDSYESEWMGGKGGGGERTIGGDGKWVIGVHGRQGADLDAIGFLLFPSKP